MIAVLLDHIKNIVPLSEEESELIISSILIKKLKKKDFLLREGEVCTANYFVLKGCLRMYLIQENGVENIIQFAIENWWITDYQSLDRQKPSSFHIQAVEDTEVVVFDRQTAAMLCDKVPILDRYFRMILQRALAASQQKQLFIYTLSGEERYHHFNDSFPGFVQRIPQYMVASYLGFTPEFISKIKTRRP